MQCLHNNALKDICQAESDCYKQYLSHVEFNHCHGDSMERKGISCDVKFMEIWFCFHRIESHEDNITPKSPAIYETW